MVPRGPITDNPPQPQHMSWKEIVMKKWANLFIISILAPLGVVAVHAQTLPSGHVLSPANPTSADNIKLSLAWYCGWTNFPADSYRVNMLQNYITVTMGPYTPMPVPLCPPTYRQEVDLGRLPAGEYRLNVILNAVQQPGVTAGPEYLITNAVFTVTDGRAAKYKPFVRLDYSGHWWDPVEPGWGLFIWHDAKDHLLAAWFTYTPDGKPIWYVIEGGAWTTFATYEGPLLQTSRPSAMNPVPNLTFSVATAGTAKLDFANLGIADEGKFTYTFTGGVTQIRSIQRFKP